MKSFSSSVINKSGKKFAPKAPARRAAPAPPRAPSRRPSIASQASASHPPAAASQTATPEPAPPSTTSVEPPAPSEPTVAGPSSVAAPLIVPTVEHVPKEQPATSIPIPVPKRKASVPIPIPVPISRPTKNVSTVPQSPVSATTTATNTAAAEPVAPTLNNRDEAREVAKPSPDVFQNQEESAPSPVAANVQEIAPEFRPAKRLRTTIETVPTTTVDQAPEQSAQLVTSPATQTPALEEHAERHDEPIVPSTARRSASTAKKGGRRTSRSTSNDAGKVKKERKRRTRTREPTPEGAELIEIAPSVVKMSDLCKDTRTGKRSKREMELRAHESAEAERKRAQQEEGQKDETPAKQPSADAAPKEDPTENTPNKGSQAGPVMRIVNGEIVLDAASLQVDRHADAEKNGDDLEDVVENSLTRKINQATYGKRSKTESWDEDMTELFYRGLRMFGTDFMVISKMFPGRSRRQIKLKFNNEERRDPQRIKETLLGPRESIDIKTYSEMTDTVYDDPRIIQQELDEEKQRIEEQYEKDKKAQEELLRNPDGVAGNNDGPDKAATKKRNNKKQSARDLGGGTEEILGSIDD
ncbi:transcription factor TFIIIB subunit BDP1 [Aspergillus mulundensis]|uniref:Putative Myb-like transcription factor n=1 Tax=Aspergillus mulundensis TaxID=1810919 RepID=A0A3D8SC33_9EURO|nr:putative Myb-like transcription factor [Aspergillus mulundensis]RDW83907.1 putative Myb-like transcription factor [Aspergillus mulundensis]